jgi:arsenate reductase (glutaredoxin)
LSVTGGKYYIADMNKIYHLSSCTTCQRILEETGIGGSNVKRVFAMQDIKTEQITPEQLEALKEKAGSYEALFSRRALKYKELKLKDKHLVEADYRRLILEDYTFLKRPVVLVGDTIFAGSEKKTVTALKAAISSIN